MNKTTKMRVKLKAKAKIVGKCVDSFAVAV